MGRTSDARARLISATQRLVWEHGYAAASVDAICKAARVQKGSFYHFFPSKQALVAAALAAWGEGERGGLDALFSPSRPPLARLSAWFQALEAQQRAARGRCGRALGCPLATLGAEVAAEAPEVAEVVRALMERLRRYVASALRDARAEGLVRTDVDARDLAAALFTHLEGVLVQARIHDDPAVAARLESGARLILGLPLPGAAPSRPPTRARRPARERS